MRTELIEVRKQSWGKGPKNLYLYEVQDSWEDERNNVVVSMVSPTECAMGRFKDAEAFIHFLNFQFARDGIEIISRVVYENGKYVGKARRCA